MALMISYTKTFRGLALAFLIAGAAIPSLAQNTPSLCEVIGNHARMVMKGRQYGLSYEEMLKTARSSQIASLRDLSEEIVKDSFTYEIGGDLDQKTQMMDMFEKRYQKICAERYH